MTLNDRLARVETDILTDALREIRARAAMIRGAPAGDLAAIRTRADAALGSIAPRCWTPPDAPLPFPPETRDALLIAALHHAEQTAELLTRISEEILRALDPEDPRGPWDPVFDLLRRRFNAHSPIHLFIAADAIGLDLPDDLRGTTP